MKAKNILLSIFALVGLTLLATSCEEEDSRVPDTGSSLAKTTWVAKVKDNNTDIDPVAWTLKFDANNRFTLVSEAGSLGAFSLKGTYIYKHPTVTCSFDKAWEAQPTVLSFDLTRTGEKQLSGYVFTKKLSIDFEKQ